MWYNYSTKTKTENTNQVGGGADFGLDRISASSPFYTQDLCLCVLCTNLQMQGFVQKRAQKRGLR